MITEAIILAGGLGTRLRSAVPELPKCMAPVNGQPFIHYVVEHLQQQGITNFIFALGYKSEAFQTFLNRLQGVQYQLSVEDEPMGTGGAIQLACKKAASENILVTNGDTLYKVNLQTLDRFHQQKNADCSLCLKPMQHFDRFGVVELDTHHRITSFKEKQYYENGFINGGVYALNLKQFLLEQLPHKFSFEKDYLEKMYAVRKIYGLVQDEYFIDIGITEDYSRAQTELG